MDVDTVQGYIYWSELRNNEGPTNIYRMKIHSTEQETFIYVGK